MGRLSSSTAETETLSPLALSYCSSLAIGIALSYWMSNKITFRYKIYLFLITILALTPFFLGASRGSLVALMIPFFIILFTKKNLVTSFKLLAVVIMVMIGIVSLSELFGSSLIERFTNTGADIEANNESAIRTVMWHSAFNQFTSNPIFGDRLKVEGFNIHPHNVFFEILQSTGFLGFLPFITLIIITFRKCVIIMKRHPAYAWVGVIFIQCLIQNMFSGSIYAASWLIMSMALVITFNRMGDFDEHPEMPLQRLS